MPQTRKPKKAPDVWIHAVMPYPAKGEPPRLAATFTALGYRGDCCSIQHIVDEILDFHSGEPSLSYLEIWRDNFLAAASRLDAAIAKKT